MTFPLAAIQVVSSLMSAAPTAVTQSAGNVVSATPLDWLSQQIQVADAQIKVADAGVQQLALGKDVELHRVMLDIEQARLSFDLVVQVRNRLVEAYQDIARLQV